ncbi:hypothetical protein FHS18_005557 [Paenibacillus phyllosphaerae]|uniref:Uncharacterized protein n=1 Tax=Paenibacillus phyllosphaerae TaxID=274593 RepID=A0A7W5B2X3_9BACL|nr:hypothetical protein [Paenibacillus phyllosphaerae]
MLKYAKLAATRVSSMSMNIANDVPTLALRAPELAERWLLKIRISPFTKSGI